MIIVQIESIMKLAEESPICQHFLETRKGAKYRSTMSWLATCDLDTLHLINQTVAKLASEPVPITTAVENSGIDIFDEIESFQSRFTLDLSSGESDDNVSDMDDVTEIMCLTSLLLFWECNTKEMEDDKIINATDELAIMSMIETLRREGLVTITGSGRFFDPDNTATPVKAATKNAKTATKKTHQK